jgi:hypothetical protein
MARITTLGILAALLVFPACVENFAPEASRLGRYTLRRINGGPLPGEVYESAIARIHFVNGTLHLRADQSFVDSTHVQVYRTREGDTVFSTDVAEGVFRFAGDTVHLQSTRGENYFMVYGATGSLVQVLEGSVLLYRK